MAKWHYGSASLTVRIREGHMIKPTNKQISPPTGLSSPIHIVAYAL